MFIIVSIFTCFLFMIQVADILPFDAIFDAVINRVPPPPNQSTQCVSVLTILPH